MHLPHGDKGGLARLESSCLTTGVVLLLLYALIRFDAIAGSVADLSWYERNQPDMSLWSGSRRESYRSTSVAPSEVLAGALIIRSLGLTAPIYTDTSERHLNRGVGLIAATAAPGTKGNVGIAGHRDGYFRALKDIAVGDTIEVLTPERRYRYRVASVAVVERSDSSSLRPTAEPTLTLVTCYPFYFIGSAPRRFVVRGVLDSARTTDLETRRRA